MMHDPPLTPDERAHAAALLIELRARAAERRAEMAALQARDIWTRGHEAHCRCARCQTARRDHLLRERLWRQ
jgi:hypothetical protein